MNMFDMRGKETRFLSFNWGLNQLHLHPGWTKQNLIDKLKEIAGTHPWLPIIEVQYPDIEEAYRKGTTSKTLKQDSSYWDKDEQEVILARYCSKCGMPGHYAPTCGNHSGKAASKGSNPAKVKKVNVWDAWQLADFALKNARLSLLFGPPGTGKTTAGNFIGSPDVVFNITLTEETPAAELRGHFIPKGGEFIWHNGPAVSAYLSGARLVLNEIDKASGDCLQFCHALLDDPEISRITLPTGDTIKPHEKFSVVATMNGIPEDLPDALRDRFTISIKIDRPHPDAIKSLPKELQAPALNSTKEDASTHISFRAWKTYANLSTKVDPDVAGQLVWGPRWAPIRDTLAINTILED